LDRTVDLGLAIDLFPELEKRSNTPPPTGFLRLAGITPDMCLGYGRRREPNPLCGSNAVVRSSGRPTGEYVSNPSAIAGDLL